YTRLYCRGVVGKKYCLTSASRFSANWTPLQTKVAADNLFDFADPTAGSVSNRFYRLEETP
ncbi:MAG: hypothetical protein NTW87_27080, partial [Planctomycetota bacterium]|nr:hypothetical protein [Planctomycetota bacterium]